MNKEQRKFWEDLLHYYHQEIEERQHPATISMLTFFHGEEHAFEDKRLAEEGYVYLLKDGRLRTKRVDDLRPEDAPYLMAELEATQALAGEHSTVEDQVTVTEIPGGATLTYPHYEDASSSLRKRWSELRATWSCK